MYAYIHTYTTHTLRRKNWLIAYTLARNPSLAKYRSLHPHKHEYDEDDDRDSHMGEYEVLGDGDKSVNSVRFQGLDSDAMVRSLVHVYLSTCVMRARLVLLHLKAKCAIPDDSA